MHSSSNGPLSIFGVLPSQCIFNKLAFGLKLQASLVFFLAYVRSIFFFKALPEFTGSLCKSTWKQISSPKTHKTPRREWRSQDVIYGVHFLLPFGILQTVTAISSHFWVFTILWLEHFDSHNRSRVTFRKCTLCWAGKWDSPQGGWWMGPHREVCSASQT